MNTITVKSSEEFKGITKLFLSNGHEITFETSELVKYIEKEQLNNVCENVGTGLVCDPNSEDVYNEFEIEVEKYLDDNFEAVCELYYKNVILKG